MASFSYTNGRRVTPSLSRRSLVQALVGGAAITLPLLSLASTADAHKQQKNQRRRKKRKQIQQPPVTPVTPAPSVRADATCPGPKTNAFILFPDSVLAQSFTAGQTGLLVRAELEIEHPDPISATGNLFLRLAPLVDAFPEPDALASAQVAASSVATGISVITFTFADPAPVTAGTSYALVMTRDGDGVIAWSTRSGADCDGRSFTAEVTSDPLTPRNEFDLIFTTFVQV
jgi:hypothetical protein